ncbi:hypothetical protein GCM10023084_34720 [Streptomyces lacrimifluminis]|uniref:Uncharacterized protein n=2 Tax=Streptomyces lacrimifluminis TaxID=1500077 RepID=A0A917KXC9_9ACTN|nr:hypothetical protein GCM10012282_28970 [Streptomyces lacrimifluminis]
MRRTLLTGATAGHRVDVVYSNATRTTRQPERADTARPTTSQVTAPGQFEHSTEGQVQDMSIIGWIILGLLAGAIAKFLLPGRDPGGLIGTTVIGVAGAFLGGWISTRFLDHPVSKQFYDGTTWAAAIGGSLVLLIAYRILFGNSRD